MIGLGLASIIGAGLSVGGALASNYQNSQMDQKNREWNEEMWNKSNEYNLPINQMERLREAHLNPNLVYGDGANTLSSYAGNLSANRQAQNIFRDAQLGQSILEAKRVENETKVAESQARKNDADARLAEFEAGLKEENPEIFQNILENTMYKVYHEAGQAFEQKRLLEEMKKEIWFKNIYTKDFALTEYEKPIDFLVGSNDKKKYYVKCYNGDDVVFASMLADYCRKGLDLENAMQLYNKTNEEIRLTVKEQQKVDSDISVNKSIEAVNYADVQLKKAERDYYKTMSNLNNAQRLRVLQELKNNDYVVSEIKSRTNLNNEQANKAIIDYVNAYQKGEIDRWKSMYANLFGSSTAGTILNAIYTHIALYGGSYYIDRNFIPKPRSK